MDKSNLDAKPSAKREAMQKYKREYNREWMRTRYGYSPRSDSLYGSSVSPKEYHKRYRDVNDERIKTRRSTVVSCECGNSYTAGHRARHLDSGKHTRAVNL